MASGLQKKTVNTVFFRQVVLASGASIISVCAMIFAPNTPAKQHPTCHFRGAKMKYNNNEFCSTSTPSASPVCEAVLHTPRSDRPSWLPEASPSQNISKPSILSTGIYLDLPGSTVLMILMVALNRGSIADSNRHMVCPLAP